MKIFRSLSSLLPIALALLSGCDEKTLQPLETIYLSDLNYGSLDARFCTQSAKELRQKNKYIFVIDQSGSNQDPPDASDPQGIRRYAPLANFISKSVADPGYTYYSMVAFSTDARVAQSFTDDLPTMAAAIDSEWNQDGFMDPRDVGFTNYDGALDRVEKLIQDDLDAEKATGNPLIISTRYTVVFVSDGAPDVPDPASPTTIRRQLFFNLDGTPGEIANRIDGILGLASNPAYRQYVDEVVIHSGYYFENRDPDAELVLSQMAARAKGQAFQFGSGKSIDFNLFAVPVRSVRYNITDIMIDNENGAWWDNARYLRDTDSDGLPDEIEAQLGSNFLEKDSDGNGVSDIIEFRTTGKPCNDAQCSRLISKRNNFAACVAFLPPTWPNGQPNPAPDGVNTGPKQGTNYYPDTDEDGLNDCEEWVIKTDWGVFDTNKDHIIDWIAVKNQLPVIAGTNAVSGNPGSDGMNNYLKLKLGYPVGLDYRKITGLKPRVWSMVKDASSDPAVECYKLNVSDIAILGSDNNIRVTLIQNTAVVDDKPILKTARAKFVGKSKSFTLSPGDFK